jgi:hypothetical protein
MLSKKVIYVVNVAFFVCIVFILILFSGSILKNYKKNLALNASVEKEYSSILDLYKKIAIFVLKNNLPQDITYFNYASNAMYDLPVVKQLEVIESDKYVVINRNKIETSDSKMANVFGCYNNKCIRVIVDENKILSKISKNELYNHIEIKKIPLDKIVLFKTAVNELLNKNKHNNFLSIVLMFFCILYLLQSIILFKKYFKLTSVNDELSLALNENRHDLLTKIDELDKVYNVLPFIYNLTDEYFSYHAHKLISGDINITSVNLIYIFQRVENFFTPQIIKKELKIIFNDVSDIMFLESDDEILFIVLLNLMFKAISRAKISSEVTIKFSMRGSVVNIEISDVGYEYHEKNDNKIKIYMLPELLLENLRQKIKMTKVKEFRNGNINFITMSIMNISKEKTEDTDVIDNVNNKKIIIKINPLWS